MAFLLMPPEVNSALIYAGPGSDSLWAAAAAWDAISGELWTTAQVYRHMIADLTSSHWRGPASESFITAVSPYVAWLNTTAELARQTAIQAGAAAMAFEQAFMMTVPPTEVAANRALCQFLKATNFVGQNTAAIATAEGDYADMWAKDVTAMADYAVASEAAGTLTPFAPPQPGISSSGLAGEEAVSETAKTAVESTVASATPTGGAPTGAAPSGAAPTSAGPSSAVAAVPSTAATKAPVKVGNSSNTLWRIVRKDFTLLEGLHTCYSTLGAANTAQMMFNGVIGAGKSLGAVPHAGLTKVAPLLGSPLNSVGNAFSGEAAGLGGQVSAAMRSAGSIGQMSVPAAWNAPALATAETFRATPLTSLAATDAIAPAASGMPGMPGTPLSGAGHLGTLPRYGTKLTVMARPFAGG
ncbi:PPE family protein [Mycobacterium decipiens]|uniref:PPE family protein n=1 Tax=Mycobacterium decipiens TaxID=1430326 RepID=A0A1X2LWY4_9MYCO|nr:PPE family protein [Mycobacterium decipiens]OSC41687.1 hypothetical protein B8W66_08170 [Mycobacterium decipiens]